MEIFGSPSLSMEYQYLLRRCILCDESKPLTVRLKPPTAAPRILSVDDGGTQGPFQLQQLLGPRIRIQDAFDLAGGAGDGGEEILERFMYIEQASYDKGRRKDSSPDSESLVEDRLKEKFGAQTYLFGPSRSQISSAKVVVRCYAQDGSQMLFTNYNGTACHRVRPGMVDYSYSLVARCTC